MALPGSSDALLFYRSVAFAHGLVIVDSFDAAIEQVEYCRPFYLEPLWCGAIKQLAPVKHDHRRHPYVVDLRAHISGDCHSWDRDDDGHQAGQSPLGWQMVREFREVLSARDEAAEIIRGLQLPEPNWENFRW